MKSPPHAPLTGSGVRRWGAAVAAVVGLLVTVPAANAVDGGPPAGLVWVGRAPDAETSTLYRAGAGGTVRRQPLPYALNAIGCGTDGTVYGLATGRRGERFDDGPHPVRVGPDGTVADLGPVADDGSDDRFPLATGYAAAVRTGPGTAPTLVVAAGSTLREVRLGPGPPRLTASRPLPGTAFIGDWTLDAKGDLVTVTGSGGRAALLRLTGASLTPVRTALPGMPAGSGHGGAATGPDGSLYVLYHRRAARGTIYRVPPTGAARAVSTVDPAESTDAAMCPVRRPAPASTVPAAPPAVASYPPAAPPAVASYPPAAPARARVTLAEPSPTAPARVGVTPAEPPPTGPAHGPRPATGRPQPATAPEPRRLSTARVIPVVGAVILGAVAVCLVRVRDRRRSIRTRR